ncbi:hypothetical protein VTN00DRAFT_1531 [Thermoascus crustaceus]|uniref:uncharacterized protein n=1 Tax=Thermoascus crustaceus TaxID=5088 RepID=UPI0037444881
MDNYMHHLFENIISELATAMKSHENNLAADRMARFQNNRLVQVYLRYANGIVKDAVARGHGHKISRARIEYDILASVDKENFPLEFKLACTSMIMHSDTFEVFWLGLRGLFQLPRAAIERLEPNFEVIEELDTASAVSSSDGSSTIAEDSTTESSSREEEAGWEKRTPVNEALDSGFWFKTKTPPPPPPPKKNKRPKPKEEEEESPAPSEQGEDKYTGAAMSSIDRPVASGTEDATANNVVPTETKPAAPAARRGGKKPAAAPRRATTARKTTTRAPAAAKRKAEDDDNDNDNGEEAAADAPVRPTTGGKSIPPEPRGTKRKAAGAGRCRGGRAKRGRTT